MTINVCFAVQKHCYAIAWSYGEICVGCGCCAIKSPQRDKARYLYWLDQWEEHLNFNSWAENPKLRLIQETNNRANHHYIRSRMDRYFKKVLDNRLSFPDTN